MMSPDYSAGGSLAEGGRKSPASQHFIQDGVFAIAGYEILAITREDCPQPT
jgi:hypothetical protein